jgi:hypothetical protein
MNCACEPAGSRRFRKAFQPIAAFGTVERGGRLVPHVFLRRGRILLAEEPRDALQEAREQLRADALWDDIPDVIKASTERHDQLLI